MNGDQVALLPARMVNEFAYCPHLFYLEFVQGEWRESADTLDGRFKHRRVDARDEVLPDPPADADLQQHARSVYLSDPTLGLVAKIDLVEAQGSEATPIDYKRGTPLRLSKARGSQTEFRCARKACSCAHMATRSLADSCTKSSPRSASRSFSTTRWSHARWRSEMERLKRCKVTRRRRRWLAAPSVFDARSRLCACPMKPIHWQAATQTSRAGSFRHATTRFRCMSSGKAQQSASPASGS